MRDYGIMFSEFGQLLRNWLVERVRGALVAGQSAICREAGRSAYDTVVDLVGTAEGGDPRRSTRGARQIAAELKKRRERSWYT